MLNRNSTWITGIRITMRSIEFNIRIYKVMMTVFCWEIWTWNSWRIDIRTRKYMITLSWKALLVATTLCILDGFFVLFQFFFIDAATSNQNIERKLQLFAISREKYYDVVVWWTKWISLKKISSYREKNESPVSSGTGFLVWVIRMLSHF